MALSPAQRSAAAHKAVATRRARQAAAAQQGHWPGSQPAGPPPPRPFTPPAGPRPFTPPPAPRPSPATSARDAKLAALVALENAVAFVFAATPSTPEQDAAFDKYDLIKAHALAPAINVETQRENDSALRLAIIALVKLAF